MRRVFDFGVALLFGVLSVTSWTEAQQLPTLVGRQGYADILFLKGKIVSMDDRSASTSVGNIDQAVAVEGDRIMSLGTDQEVRALAGPQTHIYDLQGRTLLPGIIGPHDHTYGNVIRLTKRFGIKFPPNGIVVEAQPDRESDPLVDPGPRGAPLSGGRASCTGVEPVLWRPRTL